MQFMYTGFTQLNAVRFLMFRQVMDDGSRPLFRITAPLALMRSAGLTLQDLPLLGRRTLEALPEGAEAQNVTLTMSEMRAFVDHSKLTAKERAKLPTAALARSPVLGGS